MFTLSNGGKQLWQWDTGQRLACTGLSAGQQVHLAYDWSQSAVVSTVYEEGGSLYADIPNALLQTAGNLLAYAYLQNGDAGYTKACEAFTVAARPKPGDYLDLSSKQALTGMITRSATSVKIPDGVGEIGDYAFYTWPGLTDVQMPNTVKRIGRNAFYNDAVLLLDSLPENLEEIGDSGFFGCQAITVSRLPSRLKKIGTSAFRQTTAITSLRLPAALSEVGSMAFSACTGLTEVTFTSTPAKLLSNTFGQCKNILTIRVPWSQDEIAGAPWGATNATILYDYTGE